MLSGRLLDDAVLAASVRGRPPVTADVAVSSAISSEYVSICEPAILWSVCSFITRVTARGCQTTPHLRRSRYPSPISYSPSRRVAMRNEVKFMRLLVVGAGSTGGYLGGRLTQAGRDVTFLVRPRRAAALRANRLEIVSPHGNVTLAPKIIEAHKIDAPYEAVLLTVKAFSLEASMGDFASAVGEDGRAGCVHAWWRLSNARLQGARNSRSDFSMRC
jgi:hypothetical protein